MLKTDIPKEETRTSSDSGASGASTDSAHSIVYLISPETRESQGVLKLPTVSIRCEKTGAEESRLILKFGNDRPATTIEGQGRHISAYMLYREAMIARLNEQDVENAEQLLKDFIAEYIETEDTIAKFNDYAELLRKANVEVIFDKEKRKAIYEEQDKLQKLFEEELPDELKGDNLSPAMLAFVKKLHALKTSVEKSNTSPMQIRNQLKQGNIFSYQTPLMEMMKGVLTILNKMENVAFEDKRTISREDKQREQSAQGGKIAAMVQSLRDGYKKKDQTIDIEKMKQHLYELFDYPNAEIIAMQDKKPTEHIIANFYQMLRRHIKLFFDATAESEFLSEDDRNDVIKDFLERVLLEQGWKDLLISSSTTSKKKSRETTPAAHKMKVLTETLFSGLRFDTSRFQLTQKFTAELPQTLGTVVAQLEEQLEAVTLDAAPLPSAGGSKSQLKVPGGQ